MSERFNVYQFFDDATNEEVRRGVTQEQAIKAVQHYTDCVASKMGIIRRVIITDDLDLTIFEWKFGEGVVFPTPEQIKESQDGTT